MRHYTSDIVAGTGFRNLVMESLLLQCELAIRQKRIDDAKQLLAEYERHRGETSQVFAPHLSALSTCLDERFVNCCRPGIRLSYRATIADKDTIRPALDTHVDGL